MGDCAIRLLHVVIWLWVIWGRGTFGADLLPGLPRYIFFEDPRHGEWSSRWAVHSHILLVPTPLSLPKAHLKVLPNPGLGRASDEWVQFWGLSSSALSGLHVSLTNWGRPESLGWVVRGYFRRKRCARMAASRGLTGWASWPRRRTGGMLPNWRLVRKLLASWIVFFSSANSSCWRM